MQLGRSKVLYQVYEKIDKCHFPRHYCTKIFGCYTNIPYWACSRVRATINGSAGKTVFKDTELVFKLYYDKENKYSDTAPIRAFFYWFND